MQMCMYAWGCPNKGRQQDEKRNLFLIPISIPDGFDVIHTMGFVAQFVRNSKKGMNGEKVTFLNLTRPFDWYKGDNLEFKGVFEKYKNTHNLPDALLMQAVFEECERLYEEYDVIFIAENPINFIHCEMLSNWARERKISIPGVIYIKLLKDFDDETKEANYPLLGSFKITSTTEADVRKALMGIVFNMISKTD